MVARVLARRVAARIRGVLVAGCAGAVLVGCAASGAPDDPAAGEIRRAAEASIANEKLVGAQVAVWHDGRYVFRDNWGVADLDFSVPVGDDTIFLGASMLKSMTGLTALQLAEEGRLDLDAPVQTYLPDFPVHPDGELTMRLLLNHWGGIRHYRDGENVPSDFFDTHYETAAAALEKFADDPFVAAPGERERYSSFGYALAAAVVERIEGRPFRDVLRARVFDRYGMSRAVVPDMRRPLPNYAKSYWFEHGHMSVSDTERPFRARTLDFSYNAGGGNLALSVDDLIAYGRAYDEGAVPPSILETIETSPYAPQAFGWWWTQDDAGRRVMHGSGASEAYMGSISYWPDEGLIVAVLSNTWGVGSRAGGFTLGLPKTIADIVLGPAE